MSSLEDLQQRVANGIVWLDQHDPGGVFHLWFTAGLTPLSPLPAHPAGDVRERWVEYFKARQTFERLDTELGRLEGWGRTDMGPPNWRPAPLR